MVRTVREVLIAGVWTLDFCLDVRTAMDLGDAEGAEIVDGNAALDTSVRRALDVTLSPAWTTRLEMAVRELWPLIDTHFGTPVTGSVGVSCLRYGVGGVYRRHRDRDPRFGPETERRRVSMIVWLNSGNTTTDRGDFDGGRLCLYPAQQHPIEITPVTGTLVAFPSDWPHEVLPVTRGTRDVVVDWLY